MKLETIEFLDGEIAHHYDGNGGDFIFSDCNRFWGRCGKVEFCFEVRMTTWKKASKASRLLRRLLRTDKSNAVFNFQRDGIVVLYGGIISFYELATKKVTEVGQLKQCRNVLHQGIAVTKRGIFFGEYGHNAERESVPVWASYDGGRSWKIAYEFAAGSIKHTHGVYHDPFSGDLWIPTGDFAGECCLLRADESFSSIERLGNGTQNWRAVSLLFAEKSILLPMDSPLEPSLVQQMDRDSRALTTVRRMDGPIWYTKRLEDGLALLQTTVEVGPAVTSNYSQLYASRDLQDWQQVSRYEKDAWPMPWFKFGTIAFADGRQTSDDFVLFGEGIRALDGRIVRARLIQL